MAIAQREFQTIVEVDQDNDGDGEYGLIGELAGITQRRGRGSRSVPLFWYYGPESLKSLKNSGLWISSGYLIQVYLPGLNGIPITDGKAPEVTCLKDTGSAEIEAINNQELFWIAYAWPRDYNSLSPYCFVVDQGGEVFVASNNTKHVRPRDVMAIDNMTKIYNGTDRTPSYNAAMNKNLLRFAPHKWTNIAYNQESVDGQEWVPVDKRLSWKDWLGVVWKVCLALGWSIVLGAYILKNRPWLRR